MTKAKIQVTQGAGYGQWEFDLQDAVTGQYVGLMLGTETRLGKIWEIQEWKDGNRIGALLRLPAMPMLAAVAYARDFLIR